MSHCFPVLAPCFIFPLPRRLIFVRMLLWLFSGVPCQRGYPVRIPLHRVRFLQKSTKRKTNKRCVNASLARVKFVIYCWWWIHHISVLSLLVFLYYPCQALLDWPFDCTMSMGHSMRRACIFRARPQITSEVFENAAVFSHQNGAFQKRYTNWRNLKTPAFMLLPFAVREVVGLNLGRTNTRIF